MNYLFRQRWWPSLAALVGLYLFLALAAPGFYHLQNLLDLALTNASVLLMAAGMTLVIIVSQIDISVGSVFALTSVAVGLLAKAGMPVLLLPLAALVIGSALGAINGALVSFAKAPSIVVTLATMVSLREALRWITGGAWVEGLPFSFQWFGERQQVGEAIILGTTAALFAALWWGSQNLSCLR